MKKNINLKNLTLRGSCILVLSLATGGIAALASYHSPKITNTDKNDLYSDYIEDTIASTVKTDYDISDCEIDVTYDNAEIVSADVSAAAKNNNIKHLKADIMDYIVKSLEISTGNINLTIE